MFKTLLSTIFVLATLPLSSMADASGTSGSIVPTTVHVEGGSIYIHGAFLNPDKCATNTPVVLQAANEKELDRMMSIALTSIASGKKLNMWLIDCVPVPWYSSAPRAVTLALEK